MFAIVTIPVVIPPVIVFKASPRSFPVSLIIHTALIPGAVRSRSFIRSTRPVSLMPFPMIPNGIPISVNPCEIRTRSCRQHADNSRRRWWTDSHADRYLGRKCRLSCQEYQEQQRHKHQFLHFLVSFKRTEAKWLPNEPRPHQVCRIRDLNQSGRPNAPV